MQEGVLASLPGRTAVLDAWIIVAAVAAFALLVHRLRRGRSPNPNIQPLLHHALHPPPYPLHASSHFIACQPAPKFATSGLALSQPTTQTRQTAVTVPIAPATVSPPKAGAVRPARSLPRYAEDGMASEAGMDYKPLADLLAAADFLGADDFTRNALIELAGPEAVKRGYVYFTEVPRLPATDLATIDRLWMEHSDGKFGYSVQVQIWNRLTVAQDFTKFSRAVGWLTRDAEDEPERKRRWYGANEFLYDMDAPKGHLPLTNGLRGLGLFKNLMQHPALQSLKAEQSSGF